MLNIILSLITRENITLFFSVVGFLGTVSGWIYYWITNHRNISVHVNGYNYVANKGLLLHVSISNKSKAATSITNICLCNNNLQYSCSHIPELVLEKTRRQGKEITSHREYFSMPIPINLTGLSGVSGYLYFSLDQEISLSLPSTEEFVICTSRGNPIKMKLPLKQILH